MEEKQVRSDLVRRNMSDMLDQVEHHDVRVIVLRYNKPAAVMVPPQWYEDAKAQIAAFAFVVKQETFTESRPGMAVTQSPETTPEGDPK